MSNAVLNKAIQLLKNAQNSNFSIGKYEKDKEGLVAVYTVRDVMEGIQGIGRNISNGIQGIPTVVTQIKSTLTTIGYTSLNGVLNSIKTAATSLSAIQTVVKIYRIARPIVEKVVDIAAIMWNVANVTKIAQDVLQYISRIAVATARTLLSRLWDVLLSTPVFAIYRDENGEKNISTDNVNSKAIEAALDYMDNNLTQPSSSNFSKIAQIMNTGSIDGTTGWLDKLYGLYSGWDVRRSSVNVGYNYDIKFDKNIVDVFWYNNDIYTLCQGGLFPTTDNFLISGKTYYDASGNVISNPAGEDLGTYYDKFDWVIYKGRECAVFNTISADEIGITKFFIIDGNVWYITDSWVKKLGDSSRDWQLPSNVDIVDYMYAGEYCFIVFEKYICNVVNNAALFTLGTGEEFTVNGSCYDKLNDIMYFLLDYTSGQKIISTKYFSSRTEIATVTGKTGLGYFDNKLWTWGNNTVQKIDLSAGFDSLYLYKKTTDSSIIPDKQYYILNEGVYTAVTTPNISNLGNYYEVKTDSVLFTNKIRSNGYSVEAVDLNTESDPWTIDSSVISQKIPSYISSCTEKTNVVLNSVEDLTDLNSLTGVRPGDKYWVTEENKYYFYENIYDVKNVTYLGRYETTPQDASPWDVYQDLDSLDWFVYDNNETWLQVRIMSPTSFEFLSSKKGRYFVIELSKVQDDNPAIKPTGKYYYFSSSWTELSDESEDSYLVATSGNNILVSKKGSDNWDIKSMNYKIELVDDELQSDSPESIENFVGNVWATYTDNNEARDLLYLFSQNRVYSITDTYNLFYNSSQYVDVSLSNNIIEADCESWTLKTEDETTLGVNSIDFEAFVDTPTNCSIQSGKVYDDILYIGLYNNVYNVDEERQNRLSGKNIVFSGVYAVNRNSSTGALTISNAPIFYTFGRKVYDFCYDGTNWYFMTVEKNGKETVYKVIITTEGSQTKISLDKIDTLDLEEDEFICSIDTEGSTLVVYCNDCVKYHVDSIREHNVKTLVKLGNNPKKFYYTSNGLMIKGDNEVFNIIKKSEDIPYDIYQVAYYTDNNLRLIHSNDSVFIVDNYNTLKLVPQFNSYMISNNYGCGYYADTTLHSWKGIAPYYFASNAVNYPGYGKGVTSRSRFFASLIPSWETEFRKFLNYSADAFIKFSVQEILMYLDSLNLQIEGDEEGRLIEKIKNVVSESVSLEAGMYIAQQFEERSKQESVITEFSHDLYELCMSDRYNDITEDFYKLALTFFYNILKEGMMAYYASYSYEDPSINIYMGPDGPIGMPAGEPVTSIEGDTGSMEYWLLRYYQVHKVEWYDSIMSRIMPDRVKFDDYSVSVKTQEFLESDDNLKFLFYTYFKGLAVGITSSSVDEAKAQALEIINNCLNTSGYKVIPEDVWRAGIKAAVADYKNTQEEQYEEIVRQSNMFPIQWDELPPKIDRDTFTYALTMLLDMIKEQIIKDLMILISSTSGILCYSCIDSNTVVEKILEASRKYYKNQIRNLYKKIIRTTYSTVDEIKEEFNLLGEVGGIYTNIYNNLTVNTDSELKKVLDAQTVLFATYAGKIIYEQVVNNDSEVSV